jgi:hypothetical protein
LFKAGYNGYTGLVSLGITFDGTISTGGFFFVSSIRMAAF